MPAELSHTDAVGGQTAAGRLHLPGCELPELEAWLTGLGEARYRAAQILKWVYEKHAAGFEEMSDVSKALRAALNQRAAIYASSVMRDSVSADGTRKLLLGWPDGATVETVWIPAADRDTACLSVQVGCPVGCRFCASGLGGLERNLSAGEIVEQALRISGLVASAGEGRGRLSNIVVMGMGEPLANYGNLVKALRIINAPWGLGIGARKITVSTVGLPGPIRRLARQGLQINLALSLHAPDDALRQELVPWARGISIAELVDACTDYFKTTGREITLEYVLLDGLNMQARHATELARIARRLRANVNLLRYNPVPGLPFRRPTAEAAHEFQRRLRACGVNAHMRTSRGADVNAACGQLRHATRDV